MPPWTDANPSLKVATVGVAPSHCPRPVYALCAFHGTTAEPNVHYLVWRAEEEPKIEAILVCRKFIVGDICSYSSESCCYEHSCSNCGRPGHPATEYKGDPKEGGKPWPPPL